MITMVLCRLLIILTFCAILNVVKAENDAEDALKKRREQLGVYMFSDADYPAMFAIIAGLSIILTVAVTFIVVGLFTMEPAKDSIIYRMTTQRIKKD